MTLFHIGFLEFTFVDLIDVLLVGYFFYRLLLFLRSVRSVELLTALIIFFAIGVSSYWLGLSMVQWFISNIAAFGLIVLVVILQPELRRSMVRLGQYRFLKLLFRQESRAAIDDVIKAVDRLADRHFGALIVIENKVPLASVIETGKPINATVSHELLETIFTPYTPLHDGAVVIRGDQVVAASCTLPLTQDPAYHRLYGMRHKAGVGVTEESDALAIIVSEETGRISYAFEGKLSRDASLHELRSKMEEIYADR